jgi:predicted membrane chloride channel (bestrophin family)
MISSPLPFVFTADLYQCAVMLSCERLPFGNINTLREVVLNASSVFAVKL